MRVLQEGHWWFEGRRRILTRPDRRPRPAEAGEDPRGRLRAGRQPGHAEAIRRGDGAGAGRGLARLCSRTRRRRRSRAACLPDGLPFAPASFDLVCAFDVIEHVDEDAASVAALGAAAEARRLSRHHRARPALDVEPARRGCTTTSAAIAWPTTGACSRPPASRCQDRQLLQHAAFSADRGDPGGEDGDRLDRRRRRRHAAGAAQQPAGGAFRRGTSLARRTRPCRSGSRSC